MVVDIRVSAYAVLEADVQVIPETAVQHHVSHHPNPVFNLQGDESKKPQSHCSVKAKLQVCEILCITSSGHDSTLVTQPLI